MLAPDELDEVLDELEDEPDEVLGADGLVVELLEEELDDSLPDDSLVEVVVEVEDVDDFESRESVR